MNMQFYCCKIPAGLMFSVSVFLFPSTFTQSNPSPIYFLDKRGDILLEGPDIPENGSVVWEWKPHSGREIQQLVTLNQDDWGSWSAQWSDHFNSYLHKKVKWDYGTLDLKIRKPTFKLAGLFILTQTEPIYKTLKEYEIFGIKVKSSPRQPVVGSDVTVSCTISKLSDSVRLHWKQMESSQQNRRNTDQIQIKNTIYLIIKHVTVEDKEMYTCEVWGNGSIIHTGRTDFTVSSFTSEPSEGDNVTLTCSVSDIIKSMRLVWINSEGKTVEEKVFKDEVPEEKSLQLIIQQSDQDRRSWTCGLFQQNIPKHLILFRKVHNDSTFKHTNIIIVGCLAFLLIVMLPVVLCLRKRKISGFA